MEENMSDAILMAGAMLIFVIALTVAMTVFSQARETMDTVLYESDATNYYEYYDVNSNVKNRIVGLETVIPTLYKYYLEDYTVVFLDKDKDEDGKAKGLHLYKTQTDALNWSGTINREESTIPPIVSKYPGMKKEANDLNKIWICSFDVDEETKRHEPWTGTKWDYRLNLEAFLKGEKYNYPRNPEEYYDYNNGNTVKKTPSFVKAYKDAKFIETIGEYPTVVKNTFAAGLNKGIRDNKNKRVIVYQLIQIQI